MVFGIWGGHLAGIDRKLVLELIILQEFKCICHHFIFGMHFLKTAVFAFLIATIPAFFGYKVSGGSLEVGRATNYTSCSLDNSCHHHC